MIPVLWTVGVSSCWALRAEFGNGQLRAINSEGATTGLGMDECRIAKGFPAL